MFRPFSASSVSQSPEPQTGGQSNRSPRSDKSEAFDTVAARRTPRNSAASRPPRYSNLSSLASNSAEHEREVETRANAIHDRMSSMSIESNASTTPTYMTHAPAGHANDVRSTFRASTATIANPPRYSSISHRYYAAGPREFEFGVHGGASGPNGQPWATLKLYNAETGGGKGGNYPRFCEGENMFGRVELSLLGPHTIKHVKLVLKGTIITSAMDTGSVNFLEQTYTVWDRSFGDPRQPRPEEKFDGKLEGDYVFPFSIPFPKYVELSNLEAVQANGQPAEGQIQVYHQNAGLGGRITAFPYDHESTIGEASPNSGIAHSHVNSSFPPEKAPLAGRTESGLGQSHITLFHVDSPSSPSGALSSPAPGSEPGPSTMTPCTYSREDPAPSTSKEIPPKGSRRWIFSKSASTSPNDSQKKRRRSKASNPAAAEPVFRGHLLPIAQFRGPSSSLYNPRPIYQIPANESKIPVVLPQSFLERDVKANIKYELTLLISHGRFSSSSKVKTVVVYNRATIPPPMPWLRRDAYQEHRALPRPAVAPEIWHQSPTVSIKGTFLLERELKVDYALSLANPLSYTRGTVIPCYLTIGCDDVGALNLISNPRSPRVRLSRVVRYLDSAGSSRDFICPGNDNSSVPLQNAVVPKVSTGISESHLVHAPPEPGSNAKLGRKIQHQRQRAGLGDLSHGGPRFLGLAAGLGLHAIGDLEYDVSESDGTPVSNAVWWVQQESDEEGEVGREGVRTLQGEIHLPSDLQPSCPFPLFDISYRVELLAPVSHVFEPELGTTDKRASDSAQKSRVYASQSVEITTGSRDDEPDVIAFTKRPSRSAVSRAPRTDIMGSLS